MKFTPIRVVLVLFCVNLAVVAAVASKIRPSTPDNFSLHQVTIQQPNRTLPELQQGKPVSLRIERIGVDIAVEDGEYDSVTKNWTLEKDKAHYALLTPEPNNSAGNTFIYGHNNRAVFAKLSEVTPGDSVVIITDNNKRFIYDYRSQEEVPPTDVSAFNYTGSPILTVQTCSGTWYEKRTLYTFSFREVQL